MKKPLPELNFEYRNVGKEQNLPKPTLKKPIARSKRRVIHTPNIVKKDN